MRIKLKQQKNVYGQRVPEGAILTVGSQIPDWQAKKLLETGVAIEFFAPTVNKKKGKNVK